MDDSTGNTSDTQVLLDRLQRGDGAARGALIAHSCERLRKLAHQMLRRQFPRLGRWEDTGDVLQQALLRLHRALETLKPASARQWYALACEQIRRELLDLCRRHFGPQGIGANLQSGNGRGPPTALAELKQGNAQETTEPGSLLEWTEFHTQVEALPDQEREVFDLVWYQQLSQHAAAAVLDVSVRTVRRRWQRAKLRMYRACGGSPPG